MEGLSRYCSSARLRASQTTSELRPGQALLGPHSRVGGSEAKSPTPQPAGTETHVSTLHAVMATRCWERGPVSHGCPHAPTPYSQGSILWLSCGTPIRVTLETSGGPLNCRAWSSKKPWRDTEFGVMLPGQLLFPPLVGPADIALFSCCVFSSVSPPARGKEEDTMMGHRMRNTGWIRDVGSLFLIYSLI